MRISDWSSDVCSSDLIESQARPDDLNVGTALKELREARGLSLGEVSARIKYSAGQLAHLEAQHWDRLPDGVPLRCLVRSEERRVGKECDSQCRSRGSQYH